MISVQNTQEAGEYRVVTQGDEEGVTQWSCLCPVSPVRPEIPQGPGWPGTFLSLHPLWPGPDSEQV